MAIIFLSFLLCCCFKKTGRKGNGCYERKANLATSPLVSPWGERCAAAKGGAPGMGVI